MIAPLGRLPISSLSREPAEESCLRVGRRLRILLVDEPTRVDVEPSQDTRYPNIGRKGTAVLLDFVSDLPELLGLSHRTVVYGREVSWRSWPFETRSDPDAVLRPCAGIHVGFELVGCVRPLWRRPPAVEVAITVMS